LWGLTEIRAPIGRLDVNDAQDRYFRRDFSPGKQDINQLVRK
jgi:hypothetical protein